jgi:predicted lipoprotein with Yx(FWY)xxD motif
MRNKLLAATGLVIAGLSAAACGSSSTAAPAGGTPTSKAASAAPHASSPAAGAAALKTAKIHGTTVLTNSKGFALYSFAPDTATTSKCSGSCAQFWPPVTGHAMAVSGATGHFGTLTRTNGTTQVTYNGHPLYTFAGDKSPGQDTGNGLNNFGGLWRVVTASGAAAPAGPKATQSTGGGGGGGGGGY